MWLSERFSLTANNQSRKCSSSVDLLTCGKHFCSARRQEKHQVALCDPLPHC